MSQDEVRRTSRQLEMKNYSIANHLKEFNNAIAIQSRSPARVGIEPSGPSGEREISNEPSQGPGPLGS